MHGRSFAIGTAVVAIFAVVTSVASAQQVALVGGMVLDGYEAPPIHNATVLIDGDRIVAVGPSDQISVPAGAQVIDTRGMTMMPGLIDLHVHTMFLGHGDYSQYFPFFTPKKEAMMEIAAKQLLMAGVTTAVDLGAPIEITNVRDRINNGDHSRPPHARKRALDRGDALGVFPRLLPARCTDAGTSGAPDP